MAKLVIGFGAAILLGVGGAAALNVFAADFTPRTASPVAKPKADRSAVELLRVEGEVKALMADGEWRYVRHGFALHRPTGIEVVGPGASATVRFQGVTLQASVGARVLIGAPGTEFGLQLERGRMVVSRAGKDITTFVPRLDVIVRGPAYGVWAQEDVVSVAVLEERAEIEHLDGRPVRYGRAREVLLNKTKAAPSVLNERLEIEIKSVSKRGRSYRYYARTAPRAVVMKRTTDGYEEIPVSISGTFSVELPNDKPEDGELVAYDSAGRQAEVDQPSKTLAETIDALANSKGKQGPAVTRQEAEAIRGLAGEQAPQVGEPAAAPPPPPPPPPARRADPAPKPKPKPKPEPAAPTRPVIGEKPEVRAPTAKSIEQPRPKAETKPAPKPAVKAKPKPKPDPEDDLKVDAPAPDDELLDADDEIDEDRF